MKKILFILLICLCANQYCKAQVIKDSLTYKKLTDKELGINYLNKSNRQNTVGFILLGLGLGAITGGIAETNNNLFTQNTSGPIIFLLGVGATVTSIPLFITGAKNKGRAEVLLHYENIFQSSHLPIEVNMGSVGIAFKIE